MKRRDVCIKDIAAEVGVRKRTIIRCLSSFSSNVTFIPPLVDHQGLLREEANRIFRLIANDLDIAVWLAIGFSYHGFNPGQHLFLVIGLGEYIKSAKFLAQGD